jgi:uncharacterized Tic20 family protein
VYPKPRRPRGPEQHRHVTSNERFAAMFSHLGANLLPVILSLLIWLTHRDVSPFVKYQAKQAMISQLLLVAVVLLIPWPIRVWIWAPAAAYGFYAGCQCHRGLTLQLSNHRRFG